MDFFDPKTGRKFEVAAGLGGREYGLFERKPNGSLRRVKQVPMNQDLNDVTTASALYAVKRGWRNEQLSGLS